MSSRRLWTEEEDRVLRMLFEQRQISRWSELAKIMQIEFNIPLRSGKQCRQRYYNHLDDTIKRQKWSPQEQQALIDAHHQIGNRWVQISRNIPGRSENCVKNKFYSILRKGLRFLNMIIKTRLKRYKQLDISIIYKIVQYCQSYYKKRPILRQIQDMFDIKKQIIKYGLQQFKHKDQDCNLIKVVIDKIKFFMKKIDGKDLYKNQIENQTKIKIEIDNKQEGIVDFKVGQANGREEGYLMVENAQNSYIVNQDYQIGVPVVLQQKNKDEKKNDSKQSFKSFEIPQMKPFDLPLCELKSFERSEFFNFKSPALKIMQSPYYDQIRVLGSLNSWNQSQPQ